VHSDCIDATQNEAQSGGILTMNLFITWARITNTKWPCLMQMVSYAAPMSQSWTGVLNCSQLLSHKGKVIVMRAVYVTTAIDSGAVWWIPCRNEFLCKGNSKCVPVKLLTDAWDYWVYVGRKRKAWTTFCSSICGPFFLNSIVLKNVAQYVYISSTDHSLSVCLSQLH